MLRRPKQAAFVARVSTGHGIIARQRPDPALRERARQLRREATDAERKAWELLRGRRTLGLRFRRQQVIGPFIVDFYCAQLRLALELDGPVHEEARYVTRDLERDSQIASLGVRVIRIRNDTVTAAHLRDILRAFVTPSPGGRGGRGVRGLQDEREVAGAG